MVEILPDWQKSNRLRLVNVFPAKLISLLGSPRAQVWVLCFLPPILSHLDRWFLNMIFRIIFMLMIASYVHVSNSATPLSSLKSCLDSVQLWISGNKLKLNPDKRDFLVTGDERQRSKYLPCSQLIFWV